MLTAKFPGGREVRAIILDEAMGVVQGVIECCRCGCRAFLIQTDDLAISTEIESFALKHSCDRLVAITKEQLLDGILDLKRKSLT